MTNFEKAIKAYLDKMAESDAGFAEKYRDGKKSIKDCCGFIMSEMQKKATNNRYGATDEEVYGLAIHYYDEEDIRAPKNAPSCRVLVTREKLTEAEIKEARDEAVKRLKEEEVKDQMRRIQQDRENERKREDAARKRKEAMRRRREEELERKRREYENADLLFNFDDEEE